MRSAALVLSVLLTVVSPLQLLAASTAPPAQPGVSYPVPSGAVPGSTPDRTDAWSSLTTTQQDQYVSTFWSSIVPAAEAAARPQAGEEPTAAPPNRLLGAAVARRAPARAATQAPAFVEQEPADPSLYISPPCPLYEEDCPCITPESEPVAGEPEIDSVNIVATPTSGTAPLTVSFSVDWSQPIQAYNWSFGDGASSYAATPSHTYSSAGTYTVQVTVTHATTCGLYSDTQTITVNAPPPSAPDLDNDGLADAFEDDLAYAFRPYYHVSYGELAGTGFADFGDYTPQTPIQTYSSVPARNHVRVKPLGKTWVNGQYMGFVQVDYFTMWNRDDGLVVSGGCIALTGGLAWFIEPWIAFNHPLDNERSAVLVAAPTVGGDYNPSAAAYSAYDYYTAAHEDTLNDKSRYFAPSSPVPAYTSVQLGLSLSKHASYPFNPAGLPLAPSWVINAVYSQIFFLYYYGYIDFFEYLIYLYIADVVFYVCLVEHFIEQGGWFPGDSKNIGDVGNPLNASGFIQDPPLRDKLNKLLWVVN